jgi:hypothetical protein
MPIQAIELSTLNQLYGFVESAIPRTGLILEYDALYCPWARSVSAAVPEVRWCHPAHPLSQQCMQHLGNFAHTTLIEKGFVLLERGRVIKAIDVDAVGGSAQPHKLERIVRAAFENPRDNTAGGLPGGGKRVEIPEAYSVLEAAPSDSDEEIKKKYRQAMLEYHPDRVAHLGRELRELAVRKSTAINEAYAAIRRLRGL